MPEGFKKEYVPGWSNPYKQFADNLLHILDAAKRSKYMENVEFIDFTKSSRKAWSLLRRLVGGSKNI